MRTPLSRSRQNGFSLLELLIVCGIIALIIGFTVPAASSLLRGTQLSQGSQLLVDQIALARQMALSKNHAVEVRFYSYGEPESPGENAKDPTTWKYRSFQAFDVLESGAAIPLGKVQRLPAMVVLNESVELSTLIGTYKTVGDRTTNAARVPSLKDPELPREVKRNYKYVAFQFLPDGSTNLPFIIPNQPDPAKWFLTLHSVDFSPVTTKTPTDAAGKRIDFFTLQIDPVSGSSKSYRPTAG